MNEKPLTFGGAKSLLRIFFRNCWKSSAKNGGCPDRTKL